MQDDKAMNGTQRAKHTSPGAKLYGRSEARFQVSADLMAYARRAWEAGEMVNPEEIRDFALKLRKYAEADREYGKELDRIDQESSF